MVVMENVGQKKLLQMVDYCQNVDRYLSLTHTLCNI